MHFANVEAGIDRPRARLDMADDDLLDVVPIHFARHQSTRLERYRAWRDAAPRRLAVLGVALVKRRESVPRRPGRDLAAGMSELDSAERALASQKIRDAPPGFNLGIGVDAGTMVGLAPALLDRGFLDKDDTGAAHGELAEMHQMP